MRQLFSLLAPGQTGWRLGLLLASAYYLVGDLTQSLIPAEGYANILFPPAGLAIGAVAARGRSALPWIALGVLVLQLRLLGGVAPANLLLGLGLALASSLQAAVGGAALRRWVGVPLQPDSGRAVLSLALVGLFACLVSSTLSSLMLWSAGHLSGGLWEVWITWWLGDLFGYFLFTPIVLLYLAPSDYWRVWRARLAAVLGVGLVVAALVSGRALEAERRQELGDFHVYAQTLVEHLRYRIEEQHTLLEQLALFMSGRQVIGVEDFARFVQAPLHRFGGALQAIEWAPRVKGDERRAFEAAMGRIHPGFVITERDAEGQMVTAGQRDHYLPVSYLMPLEGNRAAVGYDLDSNPSRRAAVLDSWNHQRVVATPPIRLVQETGSQAGMLLVRWVDAGANGPGLVLTVLRVGNFMEVVLGELARHLVVRLRDEASGETLYDTLGSASATPLERQITFGGRTYRLEVGPSTAYLQEHRHGKVWLVAFSVLSLLSLLSLFILMANARTARVEQLVEERTAALKQATDDLAESNARWELALRGTNEGIWDWKITTNQLYFSERWVEMLGLLGQEIVHEYRTWESRVHPEDLERVQGELSAHLEGRSAYYQAEYRIRHSDGHYLWVLDRGMVERDADGMPLRMAGSLTDITDRRESQAQAHERAEQLSAIFQLSPDGFVSFDAERRVRFASPAFLQLTGLAEDQVVGADEAGFSRRLASLCLESGRFPGFEALRERRNRPGGTPRRQVMELAEPGHRVLQVGLRESLSGTVSQILYVRDITHESEVDRMKSEFLSTAAHELRTPMASIYGFTELLLNQAIDESNRQEVLKIIYRQSELLVSIINELLDLARIEARRGKDFQLETIELCQLVREGVEGYRPPEGREPPALQGLECHRLVKVDRKKMLQAINNVISNAYKYSPAGGPVTLEYVDGEAAGEAAGQVGLRVTDRGIGMTEEQLKRVCERFYRADSSGSIPGTGLGMSVVEEIVALHGGKIDIQSRPGEGTRVTLWVPAHEGKEARRETDSPPVPRALDRPVEPEQDEG